MLQKHFLTFYGFDFATLKSKFLKTFTNSFVKCPELFVPYIQISNDIIEFKNGLYIISTDNFFNFDTQSSTRFNTLYNLLRNLKDARIKTSNYCTKKYKYRKNFGLWVKLITKKLIDPEKVIKFLKNFTRVFNRLLMKEKKKQSLVMLLTSSSASVKAALTTQIIRQYLYLKTTSRLKNRQNFILKKNINKEDVKLTQQLGQEFPYFIIFCNKQIVDKNKALNRTFLKNMKQHVTC